MFIITVQTPNTCNSRSRTPWILSMSYKIFKLYRPHFTDFNSHLYAVLTVAILVAMFWRTSRSWCSFWKITKKVIIIINLLKRVDCTCENLQMSERRIYVKRSADVSLNGNGINIYVKFFFHIINTISNWRPLTFADGMKKTRPICN